MAFTLPEILNVLQNHLSPAEIADGLGLSAEELVDELEDYIAEHYEDAVKLLEEHGLNMEEDRCR